MQNKKGFTLIELMIVVAIIAILAMIAVPMYQRYIERSRNSAAQAFLHQMATALTTYNVDNAGYPVSNITDAANVIDPLMPYGFRPDGNIASEYQHNPVTTAGFLIFAAHKAPGSTVYVYDNMNASGVQAMFNLTNVATIVNGVPQAGPATAYACSGTLNAFEILTNTTSQAASTRPIVSAAPDPATQLLVINQ